MPYRSPARFLAPLALAVSVVAIYAIVHSEPGGTDSTATRSVSVRTSTTPKARRPTSPRRYTVRPGDTLSAIAERTGVSLQTLQGLNAGVDAQSLHAGQKLKLSR